jgi:cytochrome P450
MSLAQHPDVQSKLREELLQISTETPTMDDLTSLPYLDAVVRETLRLNTPVTVVSKIAMKDDMVPVDIPFSDNKGNTRHTIE